MEPIIKDAIFFLILINPISKIVLVGMLPRSMHKYEIKKLLIKSTLIALGILISFTFFGKFILNDFFQIDINALRIAGGIILGTTGYRALRKGLFFQVKSHKELVDMAIVPLASPLIAGPATITAAIVKASSGSPLFVSISLVIALIVNLILALSSLKITQILNKYNLSGALIRITGLFIMSIGINMIMIAIKEYFLFI